METKVKNVRVKYIRPTYQNLKEWIECDDNVYIGRKGVVFIDNERFPKNSSIFANPFKINKNCSRQESLKKYKFYILNKIENENYFLDELLSLKGKNLGCWCKPEDCHGDILTEIINKY